MLWFLRWMVYFRNHPKRDWQTILGGDTVPLWILDMEQWFDTLAAEGAVIRAQMNRKD